MHRSSRLLPWLVSIALAVPAAGFFGAEEKKPDEPPDPAADINAPRPDARRIEFETDQGTWMSVDVSPDGRTIVFDLLGDVYAIPLEGGLARALTRGPAFDTHPRFSPDGKTIAFTSDRGASRTSGSWTRTVRTLEP